MLARTVLLNAGRQSYFDACAANGDDVVRVTVSGNACPACAVWENRLLSISGATKGLPTVEEATAAGLCHPNCTHSFVAVGDYLREQDFTEDGRPKQGPNSRGKEAKDDPESWRQYRLSGKPRQIQAKRIKGEHSYSQDASAINPNFGTGKKEWTNNCQRCVYAYELRRRGFDVEAMPRILNGEDAALEHWADVCKDAHWEIPNYTTGAAVEKGIRNAMAEYGDGSRAVVYVQWKNSDAHVFIAEQVNGKTVFVDPQSGKTGVEHYFSECIPKEVRYLRIDKLKFSDYIKMCYKKREAKNDYRVTSERAGGKGS